MHHSYTLSWKGSNDLFLFSKTKGNVGKWADGVRERPVKLPVVDEPSRNVSVTIHAESIL